MKGLVLMGEVIFLMVFVGSAAAMDCRLGEKYYFQAKSATDPERRIEWLLRSIEVCPNFNSWYMLGLLYKNQGKINEAIEAFVQAEENAGPSKAEASALARRGRTAGPKRAVIRGAAGIETGQTISPRTDPGLAGKIP